MGGNNLNNSSWRDSNGSEVWDGMSNTYSENEKTHKVSIWIMSNGIKEERTNLKSNFIPFITIMRSNNWNCSIKIISRVK